MKRKIFILISWMIMSMLTLTACDIDKLINRTSEDEKNDISFYLTQMNQIDLNDTSSCLTTFNLADLSTYHIEESLFYREDGLFDTPYQIYMKCSFDEQSYLKEVERLKSITSIHEGMIQEPIWTEDMFAYPAEVTIFTENQDYEYVLFDGDNKKIIYVYNRLYDINNGNIPEEYLPLANKAPMYNMSNGYNMYYFQDGAGSYIKEGGEAGILMLN